MLDSNEQRGSTSLSYDTTLTLDEPKTATVQQAYVGCNAPREPSPLEAARSSSTSKSALSFLLIGSLSDSDSPV